MISWIIKNEVCVICRSRRLRQMIQTRGFDNSWYHAKTEFNNCFIIHFLNNRQKKTFSHSVSEENTPRGLVTRQTLNLHDKCSICSRYCIYHVKFTSYCELIKCSRPIRSFILSLMYNNMTWRYHICFAMFRYSYTDNLPEKFGKTFAQEWKKSTSGWLASLKNVVAWAPNEGAEWRLSSSVAVADSGEGPKGAPQLFSD